MYDLNAQFSGRIEVGPSLGGIKEFVSKMPIKV